MLAVLASLALGALHALGPDHLLAIAALASREGLSRSVLKQSARFGIGHALTLGVGALVLQLAAGFWPAWLDGAGERLGGAALVVIGLPLLAEGLLARLGLHLHRHRHGEVEHAHPHFHRTGAGHAHRHLSGLATGALMALGGIRGLVVALPAASASSVPLTVASVLSFGLGVFAVTVIYGLAVARVSSRMSGAAWTRFGSRALGATAVATGLFLIVAG
jgi:hypothetical protein